MKNKTQCKEKTSSVFLHNDLTIAKETFEVLLSCKSQKLKNQTPLRKLTNVWG